MTTTGSESTRTEGRCNKGYTDCDDERAIAVLLDRRTKVKGGCFGLTEDNLYDICNEFASPLELVQGLEQQTTLPYKTDIACCLSYVSRQQSSGGARVSACHVKNVLSVYL